MFKYIAPMLMHIISITSVIYLDISVSHAFQTIISNDEVGKLRMTVLRSVLGHCDPEHDSGTAVAALETQLITIESIIGHDTTEMLMIQQGVDDIRIPGASMHDMMVSADHIVSIVNDHNSDRIHESHTRMSVVFVVCSIIMFMQMIQIAITLYITAMNQKQCTDKRTALRNVQTELFAGVTHDIRQPAHAISFLTEEVQDNINQLSTLLNQEYTDIDMGRINTIVRKSSDCLVHMDQVVDDLLDTINNFLLLSEPVDTDESGNNGTIKLNPVPFTLGELKRQVLSVCCPIATQRGLTFEMNVSVPMDTVLIGDVRKIRRILINLGTNAIQYTPVGGGMVTCDVTSTWYPSKSTFTNSIHLRFSVVDQGKGITNEAKTTIFDPFVRGIEETVGTGSGLGLSICHKFITLMGGKIDLTSQLGIGTTFSFVLLLHTQRKYKQEHHVPSFHLNVPEHLPLLGSSNLPNQLPCSPELRVNTTTTINVLMADDVKINRDIFKFAITKVIVDCGLSLQTLTIVDDGTDAVDAFMKGLLHKESYQSYDLVFLDHHMINMTGIEATEKIREHEKLLHITRPVPIIAVTGSMNISEEWYSVGLNHILSKPFSRGQLKDVINEYIINGTSS